MTKLLFVCLGNICRSPTAEGVMAALVKRAGKSKEIHCDSAGTGGWHEGLLDHLEGRYDPGSPKQN